MSTIITSSDIITNNKSFMSLYNGLRDYIINGDFSIWQRQLNGNMHATHIYLLGSNNGNYFTEFASSTGITDNGDYYSFNGTTSGVVLGTNVIANATHNEGIIRFRPTDISTTTSSQILWKSGGTTNGLAVGIDGLNGTIGIYNRNGGTLTSITISKSLLTDNLWYTLIFTTGGLVILEESTGAIFTSYGSLITAEGTDPDSIGFASNGNQIDGTTNTGYFSGDISSVRIFESSKFALLSSTNAGSVDYHVDRFFLTQTANGTKKAHCLVQPQDHSGVLFLYEYAADQVAYPSFGQRIEYPIAAQGKTFTLSVSATIGLTHTINVVLRAKYNNGNSTYSTDLGTMTNTAGKELYTFTFTMPDWGSLQHFDTDYWEIAFEYRGTGKGFSDFEYVRLEPGSVPAVIESRDKFFEDLLCKRFFERRYQQFHATYASAAGAYRVQETTFKVDKRIIPTVTFTNITYTNGSALAANDLRESGFNSNVTAAAAGRLVAVFDWRADAEFY